MNQGDIGDQISRRHKLVGGTGPLAALRPAMLVTGDNVTAARGIVICARNSTGSSKGGQPSLGGQLRQVTELKRKLVLASRSWDEWPTLAVCIVIYESDWNLCCFIGQVVSYLKFVLFRQEQMNQAFNAGKKAQW
jgi:hypothetical protein